MPSGSRWPAGVSTCWSVSTEPPHGATRSAGSRKRRGCCAQGGRLVFLTNSLLSALCVPADEGVATERLMRSQRDVYQVHWPGGGVEFHPSHGDWVRLLRSSGFVVEALHEIYAPADSPDHPFYEIVSAAWAARWPAEELWVACRTIAEPVRGAQTAVR